MWNEVDRYCASTGSYGAGCCADRTGIIKFCRKKRRLIGGLDRSKECSCKCSDSGGCGIRIVFILRIYISYPDPDCSSRRISDSVGMRNPGFYTGSRSFMVCNPEFSGAKVRYGCNPYDPSGTVGYHIRAYRTSGSYQ